MSIDGSPTRPRFSSIKVVETEDSLVLRWVTLSPAFVFLAFFFVGSALGIAGLVWALSSIQEPLLLLVGVPLWIFWVCLGGVAAKRIEAYTRLTLSPQGLVVEKHGVASTSTQRVPLSELRRVRVRKFRSGGDAPDTIGIEILTVGRSYTFGFALETLERDWIAYRMEQMLEELQQPNARDEREDDPLDCRNCEPPGDSKWDLDPDSTMLAFRQIGRRHTGRLFSVTIANLTWNGGVSVFLGMLLGLFPSEHRVRSFEWWGLFLFMIPFEVMGLILLYGFVNELLEPLRVTRWIFRDGSIDHGTTRLGLPLGLRCVFQADGMRNAAVRGDLGPLKWPWAGDAPAEGENFGLLLIDADNREICSIRQLTLGEARWMKGRLQEAALAALPDPVDANEAESRVKRAP